MGSLGGGGGRGGGGGPAATSCRVGDDSRELAMVRLDGDFKNIRRA
jgi:hypothetical protein